MANWQKVVLLCIVAFILILSMRQCDTNAEIDSYKESAYAKITRCSHVRSSGLIIFYSFDVNGTSYVGKGVCNELKRSCSESQCCVGVKILVEYSSKDPSQNRFRRPIKAEQ